MDISDFQNFLASSLLARTYLANPDVTTPDRIGKYNGPHINSGMSRATFILPNDPCVYKYNLYGKFCQKEIRIYANARANNLSQYFVPLHALPEFTCSFRAPVIKLMDREDAYWLLCALHEGNAEDEVAACIVTRGISLHDVSIPSFQMFEAETVRCGLRGADINTEIRDELFANEESPLFCDDPVVGETFYETYGAREYERLTKFCLEEGINDLHRGNVGYRYDALSEPVFFDYAGYDDDDNNFKNEGLYEVRVNQ